MGVLGLLAYFIIGKSYRSSNNDLETGQERKRLRQPGIAYNRNQYSATGWDMLPHRDFWREVPTLARDLVGHVFTNVRNSGPGGRGGYSSLG